MRKNDGTYFTAIETKKFKERQAKKEKLRKEAEEAGTIVGPGGADATTDKDKDEAIKKNLAEQSTPAASAAKMSAMAPIHIFEPR